MHLCFPRHTSIIQPIPEVIRYVFLEIEEFLKQKKHKENHGWRTFEKNNEDILTNFGKQLTGSYFTICCHLIKCTVKHNGNITRQYNGLKKQNKA